MNQLPIGVFDSGVGGLSVLREIRHALPAEDLLYVADSGAAPYGDRSGKFISARAETIVGFFLDYGVKAVVVACNTATAVAIQALRARFTIAIVAVEPAVKPAVALTRSGVIGILATSQTLTSENFSRLIEKYGNGVRIISQPCPGLVERVESAALDGAETEALLARYIVPLIEQGVDTLVLGCTHYPFLRSAITTIAGPNVSMVDPAAAVARELHRRLHGSGLLTRKSGMGTERFWTSGQPEQVQPVIVKLWGREADVCALPAFVSS